MNQLTINGAGVEVHELDDDTGLVRFKLDPVWRDPMDFIVPQCTALEYMLRVHNFCSTPEKPSGFWSRETNRAASNSEIRRWVEQGGVRFNGAVLKQNTLLDFPLYSVILFPKGNRITIL